MSEEIGGIASGAFDPRTRSEEQCGEIEALERSAVGDRDVDKCDRRMFRALRRVLFADVGRTSNSAEDNINDAKLLGALQPLEALAADSHFATIATEIGLRRAINQLRMIYGSAEVKKAVSRSGAAPRSATSTFDLWIVIETAKRAKRLNNIGACKLVSHLGGIHIKKDVTSQFSNQKTLPSMNSIRRMHYEENKKISENIYSRIFGYLCVSQRFSEWRESGSSYDAWERKRLAEIAKGAPILSSDFIEQARDIVERASQEATSHAEGFSGATSSGEPPINV